MTLTLLDTDGASLAALTLTDAGLAHVLELAKSRLPAGVTVKSIRTSDGTIRVEAGVPVLGEVVASIALEVEPG